MPRLRPCGVLALLLCCAPRFAAAQEAIPGDVEFFLGASRPAVLGPAALGDALSGSWGVRASAAYVAPTRLRLGIVYDLWRFEPRDPSANASGGGGSVQVLTAAVGFAGAPELPVQPFLLAGPSLVVSVDDEVRGRGARPRETLRGSGALATLGVRVPLGQGAMGSVSGTYLISGSRGGFSRSLGALELGVVLYGRRLPSRT